MKNEYLQKKQEQVYRSICGFANEVGKVLLIALFVSVASLELNAQEYVCGTFPTADPCSDCTGLNCEDCMVLLFDYTMLTTTGDGDDGTSADGVDLDRDCSVCGGYPDNPGLGCAVVLVDFNIGAPDGFDPSECEGLILTSQENEEWNIYSSTEPADCMDPDFTVNKSAPKMLDLSDPAFNLVDGRISFLICTQSEGRRDMNIKLECCDFEVDCPTGNDLFLGTFNCNTLDKIPACPTSAAQAAAPPYNIIIGDDPCGTIEVLCNDDITDYDVCVDGGQTVTRTITIFDDLNNNQTLDQGEESEVCEFTYQIEEADLGSCSGPGDKTITVCEDSDEYSNWRSSFSYSAGDCSSVKYFVNGFEKTANEFMSAPMPDICGGSVTLKIVVTDPCLEDGSKTCEAKFTVPDAPDLVCKSPDPKTTAQCDAGDFGAWITGFSGSGGGCDASVSYAVTRDGVFEGTRTSLDGLIGPDLCGGSVKIDVTVSDDCFATNSTCGSTYTVPDAPALVCKAPTPVTTSQCDAGDFASWIGGFAGSGGGCDPNVSYAVSIDGQQAVTMTSLTAVIGPDECGGSVQIDVTVSDDCFATNSTCGSTYTVPDAPALVCKAPTPVTTSQCDAGDFASWIGGFAGSGGGCDPNVSYAVSKDGQQAVTMTSLTGVIGPDECGGSVQIDVTVSDDCFATNSTCGSTYTVPDAPALVCKAPTPVTTSQCDAGDFASWIGGFAGSGGGCDPNVSYAVSIDGQQAVTMTSLTAVIGPDECGGSVQIDVTVSDDCFATNSTCGSTYTVPDAPALVCKAPTPVTTSQCDAGDFASWIGGFAGSGGGCDPNVSYAVSKDGQPAVTMTSLTGVIGPDECGGSVQIDVTVSDDCFATNSTCGSTYTVPDAPALVCKAPTPVTTSQCDAGDFASWIGGFAGSGGGCDPNVSYAVSKDGQPAVTMTSLTGVIGPDECGGSVQIDVTVSDDCFATNSTCGSTYTVPDAPALVCKAPTPVTTSQCDAGDFASWIGGFAGSGGGCDPNVSYAVSKDGQPAVTMTSLTGVIGPDECGGSVQIDVTVSDDCFATNSTCGSTYTVPDAPALVCKAPTPVTMSQCDAGDFASWIGGFAGSGGGCDPSISYGVTRDGVFEGTVTSIEGLVGPSVCGGSLKIDVTVSDDCFAANATCSSTYIVPPPPPVYLTCPSNKNMEACLDQYKIDKAFKDWLEEVEWGGGCNARLIVGNAKAPDFCGGSTTVTWTVRGDCDSKSCSATFSVDDAPPVYLQVPANKVIAACTSQAEIEEEYNKWLLAPAFGGGCHPYMFHNSTSVPDACGETKTITWTVASDCVTGVEKSAQFTVLPALTPVISCPSNKTMPSCSTESEVSAEFQSWLNSVSMSGGCPGIILSNDNTGPPSACGGSTTVTWSTDGCVSVTCSATFTVAEKTLVTGITIPEDITLMPCMTSEYKIDEMYTEWLASPTFTGGCRAVLTHNGTGPPSTCGGASVVTWTVVDDCGETVLGTATFKIDPSPDIDLVCPGNFTTASGLTEAEIAAEFEKWVGSATFVDCCNATLENTSSYPPKTCGGSVTVTWFVTSDCRPDAICSAIFSVPNEFDVSISCPDPVTLETGFTQAEVDAKFAEWLAAASTNHSESLLNNNTGAPSANGGSTLITWTTNTGCGEEACSASFTVRPPQALSVECPENYHISAAQSEGQINQAFNNWLSSIVYSGGCNASVSVDYTEGTLTSGDNVIVKWSVTSDCDETIHCQATFCVVPESASLVTNFNNEAGEFVENVRVDLSGDMTLSDFTDQTGSVSFSVPMHNNFEVAGKKSEGLLNGVTTYDIVLAARHLLGITPLTSPYLIIAADVNGTGSVSTGDIIAMRKAILTITDRFPNNDAWRFVDAEYIFPEPNNPWHEAFPERVSISDFDHDMNTNFIGIKIGDLNGSAVANELLGSSSPTAGNMIIGLEERELVAGQQYDIEFKARDFNHFGYQFTVGFDGLAISVDGVTEGELEGLSQNNFSFLKMDQGAITTSWDNPNGAKLGDNETLFTLSITAHANTRLSEVFNINSTVTIAEAVNSDLEPTGVSLEFYNRKKASFVLYQNTPNPFSNHTLIQFNLPSRDQVQLKIFDVAGKVVYTQTATWDKGTHQIRINKADLGATGILYYQVETSTDVATRKMILLE